MQLEDSAAEAKHAIDDYQAARRRYADAVRLESEMEDDRAAVKLSAILRLMQSPDPRYPIEDGKPVKTMPATEAEKYVELDKDYASYRVNQRNLIHSRMRAETEYHSATMRAQLYINVSKNLLGVA
jgi:hypothetical protein